MAGSRQTYAPAARLWLWVGILTGLRPKEWEGASLDESGLVLRVRNAKQGNGRGNGTHRHLRLHRMMPDEQNAIRQMVDLIAASPDFPLLYARVRKIVWRTAKRCWPRRTQRPSLYSARHQWAANAKRIYSKRVVAALAGHASEETAGIHYARKSRGEVAHLPEPTEQDIQAVRKQAKIAPFSRPVTQETDQS